MKKKKINYVSLRVWCGIFAFIFIGLLILLSNLKVIHIGKYRSEEDYIKFNADLTFEFRYASYNNSSVLTTTKEYTTFTGDYKIEGNNIILMPDARNEDNDYFINHMSRIYNSVDFSCISIGTTLYKNYFAKIFYGLVVSMIIASIIGFIYSFMPYFKAIKKLVNQEETENIKNNQTNKIVKNSNKQKLYNNKFIEKSNFNSDIKNTDWYFFTILLYDWYNNLI